MAKGKTSWFCAECGHESMGWLGRCPTCSAWNSFTEASRVTGEKQKKNKTSTWVDVSNASVTPLSDVATETTSRFTSGSQNSIRYSVAVCQRLSAWRQGTVIDACLKM